MKSAAAAWSRGLYRPIRAFWSWGLYILLLLTLYCATQFTGYRLNISKRNRICD